MSVADKRVYNFLKLNTKRTNQCCFRYDCFSYKIFQRLLIVYGEMKNNSATAPVRFFGLKWNGNSMTTNPTAV